MDATPLLPAASLSLALKGLSPLSLGTSAAAQPSAAPAAPAVPASVSDAVANGFISGLGPFGALLQLFHPTDTAQAAKGLLFLLVLIVTGLALVIGGAYIVVTD